jgi:hypothetical protein
MIFSKNKILVPLIFFLFSILLICTPMFIISFLLLAFLSCNGK